LPGLATPDRRPYTAEKAEVTVTTETTPQLGEQGRAVQVLADLIAQHPKLPAAYITLHAPIHEIDADARLDIQLDGPAFEDWRSALNVDPAGVALHATVSNTWLAFDTVRNSVRVHVAGFMPSLTAEQLTAPRDTEAVKA
jgi:hypothetical protein